MSRIGKLPIAIPDKVEISLTGNHIKVKGPKGELARELSDVVAVAIEDKQIIVSRPDESRQARSHQGLTRSLVANMVTGVTAGFTRTLEINGVGYRAEQRGNFIRFDLGYSHPILFELPKGVTAAVIKQTVVTLTCADKELVGQVAAAIRNLRKPEPYKGKGVKYQEEVIRRKAGKAGGKK